MSEKTGNREKQKGTAVILALTFLSVLMMATSVFVTNLVSSANFGSSLEAETKSFYIAEAGLQHAVSKLSRLGHEYRGESDVRFADGRFTVVIERTPSNPEKTLVISRAALDGYPEYSGITGIRAVAGVRKQAADNRFAVSIESWTKDF